MTSKHVPVTILTGFLGSGKTTLLNRILQEQHGHRIAVIENEFGEEGVDNDLLLQERDEQIVEMNNGCICCTVRGDLIRILGDLRERRERGEIGFERVVIETTGMADPGPVAQTFFIDDDIADYYLLDAVITIVDARHGEQQLDEHKEAQEQVGFADRILMSKVDLVDEPARERLTARLRRAGARAAHRPAAADESARPGARGALRRRPDRRDPRHPRLQPECGARDRPELPGERRARARRRGPVVRVPLGQAVRPAETRGFPVRPDPGLRPRHVAV